MSDNPHPNARWGRAKKDPKFRELAYGRLQCIKNENTVIEPVGYGKYRSVARNEMKEAAAE